MIKLCFLNIHESNNKITGTYTSVSIPVILLSKNRILTCYRATKLSGNPCCRGGPP